jgi:hypothetical protein
LYGDDVAGHEIGRQRRRNAITENLKEIGQAVGRQDLGRNDVAGGQERFKRLRICSESRQFRIDGRGECRIRRAARNRIDPGHLRP